jgi:transposase
MSGPAVCVGIDVSKATLDLALRPTGERWTLANDEAAIQGLVQDLRPRAPSLIVLEATGPSPRRASPWWSPIRAKCATSRAPRVS